MKKIVFKKCGCENSKKTPHGHFICEGKIFMPVVSLASGRYIMMKLERTFQGYDQVEIELEILSAGLPRHIRGDIALTKQMLQIMDKISEAELITSLVQTLIKQIRESIDFERARRQAEMK